MAAHRKPKPPPKNVLALIKKHQQQKPKPAPRVIPESTLWNRIRLRKNK